MELEAIVQSTINICSMLTLGGSGHAPRKILKNRCFEMLFEGMFEHFLYSNYCRFLLKNLNELFLAT